MTKPLTQQQAYDIYDFLHQRVFGWTIVIGTRNLGRIDGRTKEAKLADRLLRESIILAPRPDECLKRLQSGEAPEDLWPETHRAFIRFCLWHRCPREVNEPLHDEPIEGNGPRRVWPDFLRQYDKPATLADMPEPPPPSDDIKAFKAARKAS